MKDYNYEDVKRFFEGTDIYKHLMQGFKHNILTLKDQEKIDELIVNLCGRNVHSKNK